MDSDAACTGATTGSMATGSGLSGVVITAAPSRPVRGTLMADTVTNARLYPTLPRMLARIITTTILMVVPGAVTAHYARELWPGQPWSNKLIVAGLVAGTVWFGWEVWNW